MVARGAAVPLARRGGSKRTANVREVVNGLMYILGSGCQWRAIPKDLPLRRIAVHESIWRLALNRGPLNAAAATLLWQIARHAEADVVLANVGAR